MQYKSNSVIIFAWRRIKACFPQCFGEKRCAGMEKYEKAEMEVVVFEAEDIITTSGEDGGDIDMSDW